MPLLGIALVARTTRREEEAGRLESLLAGRASRRAPTVASLVLGTSAILVTTVAFAVGLTVFGVPAARSVLYAASLGALAFVFAGLAALLAQLTLHARNVYSWSLVILAIAYVVRGVGDVTRTWITWLSPLGWAEKAAPFGPARWWALLIPVTVGVALTGVSIRLATNRDLGSALVRGGAGPEHASRTLQSPLGLALWIHRSAFLGWLAGSLILAGTMGALAQQMVDAMTGNPALAQAMGVTGDRPQDAFLSVTQLYLAVLACGYVVQSVATMRHEETEGRLEPRLAGAVSRARWLVTHLAVLVGGLLVIVAAGSTLLALTTAWSIGSAADVGRVLGAGAAYLPAELVLAGIALAAFGLRPRALATAWTAFALTTFIAFLGPGLQVAGWVLDLAPTTHIGNPPLGAVHALPLVILSMVAAAFTAAAFTGFRRRGIPQG
jgi:ABC-2 type transport system permease protein